jgi:hypothetical protein
MADMEKSLLYVGLGFFAGLYIMSHVRTLRPGNARSLGSLQDTKSLLYVG